MTDRLNDLRTAYPVHAQRARDRRWNGREWVYDAIHHIDGDPRNNDPANLRIVEVPTNKPNRP